MTLRTVAACALVLCLALAVTASAAATTATLRVVGKGGAVLAERSVKTAKAKIDVKTSPRATCLGAGTGGSGAKVAVQGDTALGLLAKGAKTIKQLAPLSLTDHFSFGLGLCGVGKSVAKGKASWYLKVDHKGATVGGEKAKVRAGDEVLWVLAPSYPYPDELVLRAPRRASAGVPFVVRVDAYDEKGKHKPAQGAAVTGASGRTDAHGKVMVTLRKPGRLVARQGDEIPSAAVPVCIGKKCPAGS